MNGEFYSWGLPVGSIAGIRVKLHWVLLLYWLFDLENLWKDYGPRPALMIWALGVGLMFLIILLHEFGHCFAARFVGGRAHEVLLWPLGGLAFVDAPNAPRPQFWVAAGGPLVNILIAFVTYPLLLLIEAVFPAVLSNGYYQYGRYVLTWLNLLLLIFNLIPLYPLDGGRIFHAVLWGVLARRGGYGMGPYYRATMATVWASRVTAVAGIIYALTLRSNQIILIVIMVWAWAGAEALRKRVQAGMGPDGVLGHDFSRGYTSLERGAGGEKRRSGILRSFFERRRRAKEASADDARRLDEILEKISRQGMGSLTRKERRFLEKMSRRRSDG